ncbi:hypothetical protein [Rhodoferax sp.]|uniref:hypothetical protein n=1 Tax=Rhodoferax sp. TaxID=50421 RepID=UPI0026326460|nr:hypothetical protein [Rhodoferax sp.]
MPKATIHPTDSRLLDKTRQNLVKVIEDNGLRLRPNYIRVKSRLAKKIRRYAQAKLFNRMRKAVRTLCTSLGEVHREVARQLQLLPESAQPEVQDLMQRAGRIMNQRIKDKTKLYQLDAPEAECITQVKIRVPTYEFAMNVSIDTTLKERLAVGMRSNTYDGHKLALTLEQVDILTCSERLPATAILDKGYQDVVIDGVRIRRAGQRRGITPTRETKNKRCNSIEPTITTWIDISSEHRLAFN